MYVTYSKLPSKRLQPENWCDTRTNETSTFYTMYYPKTEVFSLDGGHHDSRLSLDLAERARSLDKIIGHCQRTCPGLIARVDTDGYRKHDAHGATLIGCW